VRSHAKVHEPIELSLGVGSVVGPGTRLLNRGQRAARGMVFGGFPGVLSPIGLNGTLLR